jgi:hypothetical protein
VAIASPEPLSDSPLRLLKPFTFLLVQHASSPVTVTGTSTIIASPGQRVNPTR